MDLENNFCASVFLQSDSLFFLTKNIIVLFILIFSIRSIVLTEIIFRPFPITAEIQ